MLLHRITHKHASIYKPGVGNIVMCSKRFFGGQISLSVSLDQLYDTNYVIPNVQQDEFLELINCKTETDLAQAIVGFTERRRGTPDKVRIFVGD